MRSRVKEQNLWGEVKKEAEIVSLSRRTDIPAFYTEWFLQRLRSGFCRFRHPFTKEIIRVDLRPEKVYAIVFWSKNFAPLIPHLISLRQDGYDFYFHFTINNYGRMLEPNVLPAKESIEQAWWLAENFSPKALLWRYDPIILGYNTDWEFHRQNFRWLAKNLSGTTQRCYFSFVRYYQKTRRNLEKVAAENGENFYEPAVEERRKFALELAEIAGEFGLKLYSCCADELVKLPYIHKAHCVDAELLYALFPQKYRSFRIASTRKGCGCYESVDIGAYDTCPAGCAYCYANSHHSLALQRHRRHNPQDIFLFSHN